MIQSPSLLSSRRADRKSAFSLVEILIVIALIAVLATLVIVKAGDTFGQQGAQVAKIFVNTTLKLPLVNYKLDVGSYPTTEEGLNALISPPAGKEANWKGPYVDEIPMDPWKRPYQYRFPGVKNSSGARGYDVWSWGEDGVESADDIGNWKSQ